MSYVVGRERRAMCRAVWDQKVEEAIVIHLSVIDVVSALPAETNSTLAKQAIE